MICQDGVACDQIIQGVAVWVPVGVSIWSVFDRFAVSFHLCRRVGSRPTLVYRSFVFHQGVLIRVHRGRYPSWILNPHPAIVGQRWRTGFAAFGRHQDNAVSAGQSIRGYRSGIFEDRKRFDRTGVQPGEIAVDTIHNQQW